MSGDGDGEPADRARLDRETLQRRLTAEFDAVGARAVSRQARDLAESGSFAADLGYELTVEDVVSNLRDAPEGYTLAERWNWWLGALDLSHGGYLRFRVREDVTDESGEGHGDG
jgi:stage V sporulation protein SpoVS